MSEGQANQLSHQCIHVSSHFSSRMHAHTHTHNTAPGPVLFLSVVAASATSITVTWDEPAQTNGRISDYVLTYTSLTAGILHSGKIVTDSIARAYTLTGLQEYTTYSVTILARTMAAEGIRSSVQTTTAEAGMFTCCGGHLWFYHTHTQSRMYCNSVLNFANRLIMRCVYRVTELWDSLIPLALIITARHDSLSCILVP